MALCHACKRSDSQIRTMNMKLAQIQVATAVAFTAAFLMVVQKNSDGRVRWQGSYCDAWAMEGVHQVLLGPACQPLEGRHLVP